MNAVEQNIAGLVAVYALISFVLLLCLYRIKRNPDTNIRKIIHICIGNFVFIWWIFTEWWVMFVFFVLPFAFILYKTVLKSDGSSIIGKATNEGSGTGLLFYALAIGVIVSLFFNHFVAASIGIVAMTYGDSMGSIIGKRYGKHKMFHNKSLEGSLAVFAFTAIMAFVVIVFYSFLITNGLYSNSSASAIIPTWGVCILAGIIAAFLEMLTPGDLDNLTVPICVTLALCILGM